MADFALDTIDAPISKQVLQGNWPGIKIGIQEVLAVAFCMLAQRTFRAF